VVTGQRLEPDRAVLACRVVEPDEWCRRCGCEGAPRDTVVRRLAHEPLGWRPTMLEVTVRRYRCTGCRACGACGARTPARPPSRGRSCPVAVCGERLEAMVSQHLTVARVAEGLAVSSQHGWRPAEVSLETQELSLDWLR